VLRGPAGARASAVEAADFVEDLRVFVGVLARVVDQTADRLARVRQAVALGDALEKPDLVRFELDGMRLRVFRSTLLESAWSATRSS
jgi:hypothetical protein